MTLSTLRQHTTRRLAQLLPQDQRAIAAVVMQLQRARGSAYRALHASRSKAAIKAARTRKRNAARN